MDYGKYVPDEKRIYGDLATWFESMDADYANSHGFGDPAEMAKRFRDMVEEESR